MIASKIKVLLNQTLDKLTNVLDGKILWLFLKFDLFFKIILKLKKIESLYNFSKVYIQSKLKNGEELIQINNSNYS